MRNLLIAGAAVLALTGCQTTEQRAEEQAQQVNAQFRPYLKHRMDAFMHDFSGLRVVDTYDVGAHRVFVFESQPVHVTRHLPAYVPSAGTYNDPAMASAVSNLAAAFAAPGVSRTDTLVCRVTIHGEPVSDEASPSSWVIDRMFWEGAC